MLHARFRVELARGLRVDALDYCGREQPLDLRGNAALEIGVAVDPLRARGRREHTCSPEIVDKCRHAIEIRGKTGPDVRGKAQELRVVVVLGELGERAFDQHRRFADRGSGR